MTLSGSKGGTFSLKTEGLEDRTGIAAGPVVKTEIPVSDKPYLTKESEIHRDFSNFPSSFGHQVDPETAQDEDG